ncbi:MAG: exodeoxyribonuclease VII large subunit [Legionella sp.]|jgi:exodeoxyribonuclease VII large subunit
MNTQITIVSVSQLNRQVKNFLEYEIGPVHVEGEVSNLTRASSGHFYFTLKDSGAQLKCVFFKNRHTTPLVHKLSDGQLVVAAGRLSLYEARGDYQLIVDQLTEAGLGVLYQRFEELKIKLAAEGLFNAERKKPIPAIAKTIGIIASEKSAALQDILSTLARRFALSNIIIYPSEVQGSTAPIQLIKAIKKANTDNRCDVLILARGGGSIEDLWAFNDEQLARQIAASSIPIVSGVGHETDYTIADFVADYRAETPTAAAAAVTPDCIELAHKIDKLQRHLILSITSIMNRKQHQIHLTTVQLNQYNPKTQVKQTKLKLEQLSALMSQHLRAKFNQLKFQLNNNLSTLHAVSPLATLDRGYAIATKNQHVLFAADTAKIGDTIHVRLAKGSLECEVINIGTT